VFRATYLPRNPDAPVRSSFFIMNLITHPVFSPKEIVVKKEEHLNKPAIFIKIVDLRALFQISS
jgi:hypothetical protein